MEKGKYQEWLTSEVLFQLEAWVRNGLTNEQIASNIGINPDMLYTWKKKYPEIPSQRECIQHMNHWTSFSEFFYV